MKKMTAKMKNKRLTIYPVIATNDGKSKSLLIEAKRLIKSDEIQDFRNMPPVRMEIEKNIVKSEILLSLEASYALYRLLKEFFNNEPNYEKTKN